MLVKSGIFVGEMVLLEGGGLWRCMQECGHVEKICTGSRFYIYEDERGGVDGDNCVQERGHVGRGKRTRDVCNSPVGCWQRGENVCSSPVGCWQRGERDRS